MTELPPASEAHEVEFEDVLATADLGRILFAKSVLQSEGIPYVTQGEHLNVLEASAVHFLVPKDQAEQARAALREAEQDKPTAADPSDAPDAFTDAQRLLTEAGYEIAEGHRDDNAFGSWSVTVDTTPPLRIAWDGKERQLLIQRRNDGTAGRPTAWLDVWVGPSMPAPDPGMAVTELIKATN